MNNVNQGEQCTFNNPIMPGFYPDPSVCRVGEDFYLVTSTFAYFPGVPIFHSRDLVHWKQIGNVLDRESQLNLEGAGHSQGIFAPTLRHHDGLFYMITTNVSHGGNFVVTATDPAGPWSDPYFIEGAEGIDPTIFFDEDGKAYYLGTRPCSEGVRYNGNWEVWLRELDLGSMKLVGDSYVLWRGAMVDVIWPEGPHLYKMGEYYYLMIAEGGTGLNHAVTIARSNSLTEGYVGNPNNPIITHRHMGKHYPVINVGHADLVQAPNGQWFMVMLASRPYGGAFSNLGRETFIASVEWEDGWPVVKQGLGKLEEQGVLNLPAVPVEPDLRCENFDNDELGLQWMFLRNPQENLYSLTERKGYLRLKLKPQTLKELENSSFVCVRQRHMDYVAATAMEFVPQHEYETAGLVVIQNDQYHVRIERACEGEQQVLRVMTWLGGEESQVGQVVLDGETPRVYIKMVALGQQLSFYYSTDGSKYHLVAGQVNTTSLSTEVAGGFVGCCIGMFSSSNGKSSDQVADFDWFEYGSYN
ncbi:alpha-N-arabinofuranosidase [Paenibacillus polysaccharolyticus]|uniref:Alpha-N-arabinofuranosidase n=1 Tax=Paenibacillus polysaccharolyticus TaxID=582692 RepID=A0A1G5KBD9_9BACL|nr:glycoside hydrolase family 43 protein [Paenibacillus polysaccharolyticus]SCY97571.1 alpha-N-arabinofuranosidase [Paenibacillus polysaccharolyticus]